MSLLRVSFSSNYQCTLSLLQGRFIFGEKKNTNMDIQVKFSGSFLHFLCLFLFKFPLAFWAPEQNRVDCICLPIAVVQSWLPTSPLCFAPWFNWRVHLRSGQSIFPTLQPNDSNTSMFHVLSCFINNLIYLGSISVSYIIAKFCNNMPFAVKCHQKVIYCNNFHLFHEDRQFLRFMLISSLKSESSYINL